MYDDGDGMGAKQQWLDVLDTMVMVWVMYDNGFGNDWLWVGGGSPEELWYIRAARIWTSDHMKIKGVIELGWQNHR